MISVVVCSINPELASRLENNITSTIGVPFEMIVLDNTVYKQSINHIYNRGAGMARYDVICFLHEDITINTTGWGNILLQLFSSRPEVGLVGIAGSKYKSKTHSGWFTHITEFDCCMITHVDYTGHETRVYSNPEPGSDFQEVVVIDGVFMCTRKSVWEEIKFDEELLKGFHFYDIDYSFRVSRKYASVVSFEIDLTHLTLGGDFGDNWIHHSKLWHDRYSRLLPFSCLSLESSEISKHEIRVAKTWLNLLMKQNVSLRKKFHWLANLKMTKAVKLPADIFKFMIYDVYKLFVRSKPRTKAA